MDLFMKIDWNPSLNDIVDNEFVNVERLERESFMYRFLHGTFTDPLKDIHEDYIASLTPEDINYAKEKAHEMSKLMKEQGAVSTPESNAEPVSLVPQKTAYVPGIFKCDIQFPRKSRLTAAQQALCLKIILSFSRTNKPDNLSAAAKKELETYLSLQKIINDEQEEFLEVAKEHWNGSNINLVREDLINLKWKAKIKRIEQLHRYYTETGTVSFIRNQEINLSLDATVLEMGKLPRIILPTWTRRCNLNINSPKIATKYFSSAKLSTGNNVSEDVNCEQLLKTHEVDLVISSSGLNCLASNLDPSHASTWILPVVVKEINGRNVVFVNKPLPPTVKNVIHKNTWIYKYILKNYLIHPAHMSAIELDNVGAEQLNTEHFDDTFEESSSDKRGVQQNGQLNSWHNVQYNVFSIGACGSSQNELMKDKIDRDYKILVRTKVDGIEKLKSGEIACVKVAPKLEHQVVLASEAVTLEEAAKQWISLKFAPDTSLIRARIDVKTSEFLQFEKRTCISINNEMKRLYNVRGEETLPLIYNVADAMTKLPPGRYLLRHTMQNGAFAIIYKEVPTVKENCIDLQAIYCDDEFRTIPNPPWPLLDKTVPTPAVAHFNRMPAMFFPLRSSPKAQKKPNIQVKKGKKKNSPKAKKQAKRL